MKVSSGQCNDSSSPAVLCRPYFHETPLLKKNCDFELTKFRIDGYSANTAGDMLPKGATKDPYGPNNPPPPPASAPSNESRHDIADKNMSRIRKSRNRPPPDKRRRTYAAAEAKEAYVRDSERSRSRSPALAQDRQPDRHYRDRSPLRDDEVTDWLPPRSHGRQIASHKNGGVRCYACNETGKSIL